MRVPPACTSPRRGPPGLRSRRTGGLFVYLVVRDIESEIKKLDGMGVDTANRTSTRQIKTVMIVDPDGNHIALAEAEDPSLMK